MSIHAIISSASRRLFRHVVYTLSAVVLLLCTGCSATKFVPDGSHLLTDVKVVSEDKSFDVSRIDPYIAQRGNTKWFSMFEIPLGIYNLSGRDSTAWVNKTLRRMGEAPVLYDSARAATTLSNIVAAMQSMGYLRADAKLSTTAKGKKIKATYLLRPREPYTIGNVDYIVDDPAIAAMLGTDKPEGRGLHTGMRFSIDNLENERRRITDILVDSGYYKFNKDYIVYDADSTAGSHSVDLRLHLLRYKSAGSSTEQSHSRYHINKVRFSSPDGSPLPLRRSVMHDNLAITEGGTFSATDLQTTYNNFARLQAVRFTNIRFDQLPDTSLLDCNIQLTTNKTNTISFRPEGTNTAGDLGAAASLTYTNRNLFRGSEVLSLQVRAAFEAITGLEGYQTQDYEEYGVEAKLLFPRFIAPVVPRRLRRSSARSELTVSYNLQNRPEFHRRVFTAAWRYHWHSSKRNIVYRLDLLDLNYVYMPWISETFKNDYLDDASNRNAILRYNYEDLFIMKLGFGISASGNGHALRANIETSGNVLRLASSIAGFKRNSRNQYTLFNIAYAQYAKFDIDYTRLFTFDWRNSLALHVGFGIAYPYGNSTILPFEKRYFAGGANSVRGWSVRELGPGSFRGTDGRIDFINQTGDMKLDLNIEYRTSLFWKLAGAVFIDAGNIWTLRDYADQPGGAFRFDEFYRQIAVSYGMGLRLNLDYFVLRLDMGIRAVDPSGTNTRDRLVIARPRFGRDVAFHFAVGLPF